LALDAGDKTIDGEMIRHYPKLLDRDRILRSGGHAMLPSSCSSVSMNFEHEGKPTMIHKAGGRTFAINSLGLIKRLDERNFVPELILPELKNKEVES
jgi:hypothetical protein